MRNNDPAAFSPRQRVERSMSMAAVPGREGKFVAKGSYHGKAIGVFTSGGDSQGLCDFIHPIFMLILWT